jgi:6-phosphogluconolactonase
MEREISALYEPKRNNEIRIFESSDEMSTDLAEYISQVSEISVKERGYFAIALSGGPLVSFLGKLCEAPYNKTLDWSKWYIFWSDERAVAKNHAESNYRITKEGFLSKVCELGIFLQDFLEPLKIYAHTNFTFLASFVLFKMN